MSPGSKTDWRASASLDLLKTRARMLQGIRAFFAERGVLEVETPSLATSTIPDPHIHSFETRFNDIPLYLQTSPEFFMKRLLACGSEDIYQVSRVFRNGEFGSRHNPEFSMLEWYRLGLDQHQLMDEIEQLLIYLVDFLQLEHQLVPIQRLSYQQAWLNALDLDPLTCNAQQLHLKASELSVEIPSGMALDDKDMWLDWLMTQAVAPGFDQQGFTFVYDYPASQAALARISELDSRVAHRFELFYGELELANGFHELTDAGEQRQRFEQDNRRRSTQGLDTIPLDEHLLAALEQGLPDCSGVALGLDRLLMALLNKRHIAEVLAFPLDQI